VEGVDAYFSFMINKYCSGERSNVNGDDGPPEVDGFVCREEWEGRTCFNNLVIGKNLFCDGVPNCPVNENSIDEVGNFATYDESPQVCNDEDGTEDAYTSTTGTTTIQTRTHTSNEHNENYVDDDDDYDSFVGWLFGVCLGIFVILLTAAGLLLWRTRKSDLTLVKWGRLLAGVFLLGVMGVTACALLAMSLPPEGHTASAAALTAVLCTFAVAFAIFVVAKILKRKKRGGLRVSSVAHTHTFTTNGTAFSSPSRAQPTATTTPSRRRASSFAVLASSNTLPPPTANTQLPRRRSSFPDEGYYSLPLDSQPQPPAEPVYEQIRQMRGTVRRGDSSPWSAGYNELRPSVMSKVPTESVVQTLNPGLQEDNNPAEAQTEPTADLDYENVFVASSGRRGQNVSAAVMASADHVSLDSRLARMRAEGVNPRTNLEIVLSPQRYISHSLPTNLESNA